MIPKIVKRNPEFVGRDFELGLLSEIAQTGEASMAIVYGRRRVGKTELLEQAYRKRNILKFEGIEGQPQKFQMNSTLKQLAEYAGDPMIARLSLNTWTDIFQLIGKHVSKGTWTVYLEEVQWLAGYKSQLVTELKYVWDNQLRHNRRLILVLCGSSPSFMINKVIRSKALYNRSQHEVPLQEFNLLEARAFLGKRRSDSEIVDAYLSVGGIPEYLKYLNTQSSVFLSLCKNSFTRGGFFSNEYQRIFTSSLASNKNYQKVIAFLSKRRFATRDEILGHVKERSGGGMSELLADLELCGFVSKYTPFNLETNSLLARYCISDPYLQFYFKFIAPIHSRIQNGDFNKTPLLAIKNDAFRKWLGFSFERMCRKNHHLIAKILGFESVQYKVGAFFSRASAKSDPGFQMDLVFDRNDKVYTICEIKYLQSKVTKKVISEFEAKLEQFTGNSRYSIQKVLIAPEGAETGLRNSGYFDRIITLKDLLNPIYW